jgi:hypothetical protein
MYAGSQYLRNLQAVKKLQNWITEEMIFSAVILCLENTECAQLQLRVVP